MSEEQFADLQHRLESQENHIQSVVTQSPLLHGKIGNGGDGGGGGDEKIREIQEHMIKEFRHFVDETGLLRWTMFLIVDSTPVKESLKTCRVWGEFCSWFENTSKTIVSEISSHSRAYAKELLFKEMKQSLMRISDTWPMDSPIHMQLLSPTGEPDKCQTLTLFIVI